MRSLYVAVALALASGNALAADFGVGISVRSDDGWLYVPIDVSKSFRIEPSIRYVNSELKIDQGSFQSKDEVETWELGVGAFGLRRVTEAAHIYYGARFAYVDTQNSTDGTGSFGQRVRSESQQDGYRIAPTLGFEYLFGGHFSVGGEASYSFLELEGETRSRVSGGLPSPGATIDQSSQGTQTRLIFRYMF